MRFICWIVGGDRGELKGLETFIAGAEELSLLVSEGRLIFWHQVAPESLPEIFSRSAVTVMPSRYEPFGIVALQAMSCKSPVVASAVGGLKHVVIHRYTGYVVPPDDAEALAWTLCGLLNPRGSRSNLARNAQLWSRAFNMAELVAQLQRVYSGEKEIPIHAIERPLHYLSAARFGRHALAFGTQDETTAAVHSHHRLECFDRTAGRIVLKRLDTWPMPDGDMFRIDPSLRFPGNPEHLRRVQFHSAMPWAAPIETINLASATITFRWLAGAGVLAEDLQMVLPMVHAIADFRPPDENDSRLVADAWQALRARPTCTQLTQFDRSTARIQHRILGSSDVFHHIHPGAELIRIRLHAEQRVWPARAEELALIISLCDRTLSVVPCLCPPPRLCHGDLASRHVLRSDLGLVLCDFEESHYVVGAFDEAFWVTHELLLDHRYANESAAIKHLLSACNWGSEADLAVAWVIVDTLYEGIRSAIYGATSNLGRSLERAECLLMRYVTM